MSWIASITLGLAGVIVVFVAALYSVYKFSGRKKQVGGHTLRVPLSVNYHFTRQCNYSCGFCFHTAKTSYVLPEEEAKRGLQLLREAGLYMLKFSKF